MSVLKNVRGPVWPLGFIKIVAPGTPVRITSLIDAGAVNAPGASNRSGATLEYTPSVNKIVFRGSKTAAHGMVNNANPVYVVMGSAADARDDPGRIVAVVTPGTTVEIIASPLVKNVFNLYDFYVDGDSADDGLLVTAYIF